MCLPFYKRGLQSLEAGGISKLIRAETAHVGQLIDVHLYLIEVSHLGGFDGIEEHIDSGTDPFPGGVVEPGGVAVRQQSFIGPGHHIFRDGAVETGGQSEDVLDADVALVLEVDGVEEVLF